MAPHVTNGRGVDASGRVAIDPSVNVSALVEANAKFAEMLRAADQKYSDSEHAHLKEIGIIRAANAETLRISDLDRLDKTRQVDVLAAASSAVQLATAVQTLQTSNDRNAETIRNQLNADRAALAKLVADTAATVSAQNDSVMKDVRNQIAELQKSSYQGVGKSSVAEPMMAEFIAEMRLLGKGQERRSGKSEGVDTTWKLLIAGVGLLVALNALGVFDRTAAPPTQPPQVIYTPAPPGTQLPSTPPATVPR